MELKRGYKQTEIGVIPEEWDVELLDRLARRGSGHTPDKNHQEYWNGDIKWISLADSPSLDRVYISDTYAKVTPAGIANSSAVVFPEGTVILSRDAGVGKSAITTTEMAVSQHFMAWRCGPELDNHFLYYWLQSAKQEFERIADGSTIKTIGLAYFEALKIPKPLIGEQRLIAAALGDADELLATLERLISKRRDIKQAAMQQLLTGQTRLPGFDGNWVRMKISDVCEYVDGVRTEGGDVGYVEIGDIDLELKSYSVSRKKKLSVPGAVKVPAGTLLISKVRPTRGAIAVTNSSIYVSSAFCRVKPTNELLFQVVCQPSFLAYLGENAIGGTYPTCRDSTILEYETSLPRDPAEQVAIAAVLSDMDAEIRTLEARRAKTSDLKQAMLQQLLTGRTRLV